VAPPERAEIEVTMSRRQNAKYKLDRRVGVVLERV
jgi:hypothetical protein